MSRKRIAPREGNFYGSKVRSQEFAEGTFLDPENFAYPSGSLAKSHRRGLARDDQGRLITVTAGIPDTYFSIPVRARVGKKTRHGHVTIDDGVLRFHSQQAGRRRYKARENMKSARGSARQRLFRYVWEKEGHPSGQAEYLALYKMSVPQLRARARQYTKTRSRR